MIWLTMEDQDEGDRETGNIGFLALISSVTVFDFEVIVKRLRYIDTKANAFHFPTCDIWIGTVLILFALVARPAFAQDSAKSSTQSESSQTGENDKDSVDKLLEGHSFHGDAFNEGPRQKARLIGGTGNVKFDLTTDSDEARAFFIQGIGQLHGFWDLEAERSFRQAAAIDPQCAMAFWGAALATVRNEKRARGFIEKANELREFVTEREAMYIEALEKYLREKPKEKTKRAAEYIKDLESIAVKFPNDVEAKAFIVHRIWQNAREGIPIGSYVAAEALLKEVFRANPLHPAHHYRIHLWDYRDPSQALESAAQCGISAPSIAHMWHMPGHIYSRLKRYEDAVYQQEASARVDHAYMIRDRVMPDEIHNFAHNNEWLIRNLIFLGRASDALDLAQNMVSLPRHPKHNHIDKRSSSTRYGRLRLFQVLREFQMHQQAMVLGQSKALECEKPAEQAKAWRVVGCGAAALGNMETTQLAKERLLEIKSDSFQRLRDLRSQVALEEWAKDKSSDKRPVPRSLIPEKKPGAKVKPGNKDKDTDSKTPDAKKQLQEAKQAADVSGKALLAIRGYENARLQDYANAVKDLKAATGEDQSWIGELEYFAGEKTDGVELVRKQVKRRPSEVIPLARLAFLLSLEGDEESKKWVDEIRKTSNTFDIEIPLFKRLGPLVESLGYPTDWRLSPQTYSDTGFRPELDSLGPFRWHPYMAPSWSLKSADGSSLEFSSLSGQPTILIFYLGHGCLHCAEQLQAFAPAYSDFKNAGIQILAISSDDESGLAESIAKFNGEMPFKLLTDSKLDVFRSYRAYDDFENQPLHGTFLIDRQGRVRWQDISYEPFMDHEFLLKEAQRLLDLDDSFGRQVSRN